MIKALVLAIALFTVGCEGATGIKGINSKDPTERGCSYIAAAIVTAATIRAIFNK
jgi:hypothetical protein